MKKASKILVLVISLLLGITIKGMAAGLSSPNVTLEGNGIHFLYKENDGNVFLQKHGMLPGESVNGTITIKNNLDQPFTVYLKAEHPDDDEELLCKVLNLSIDYEGKSIYKGPLIAGKSLEDGVDLDVVNPGEEKILNANVTLDSKASYDKYKNQKVDINWVFTAVGDRDERVINSSDSDENKLILYIKNVVNKVKKILPKTGYDGVIPTAIGLSVIVYGIVLLQKKKNREI